MGRRFESCRAHHHLCKKQYLRTLILELKKIVIFKKHDHILEVILEETTIKITLKKNRTNTLDILKTWSLSQRVSYHPLCLRRFYNLH